MSDIIDKLEDLYKQATEERSHYYTGSVLREAIREIATLRAALGQAQLRFRILPSSPPAPISRNPAGEG